MERRTVPGIRTPMAGQEGVPRDLPGSIPRRTTSCGTWRLATQPERKLMLGAHCRSTTRAVVAAMLLWPGVVARAQNAPTIFQIARPVYQRTLNAHVLQQQIVSSDDLGGGAAISWVAKGLQNGEITDVP